MFLYPVRKELIGDLCNGGTSERTLKWYDEYASVNRTI